MRLQSRRGRIASRHGPALCARAHPPAAATAADTLPRRTARTNSRNVSSSAKIATASLS
jgi:hypothetical protein